MDILTVEGGSKLRGTLAVSGSKNAALPVLIATLLTDDPCTITNVPDLRDIETVISLLVFLGKQIARSGNSIEVKAGPTLYAEAPYELVRRMRASIVVVGPLLARLGHVKASLPGGCAIGGRPINIHLDGFRALGAELQLEQGYVELRANQLKGATIHLDFASVGATENLMMAATLARGRTILNNAAMEPEISDLAAFLSAMGARIDGAGTETLTIDGVSRLRGAAHRVVADRIEAGTYMIAGALCGGELKLQGARLDHLAALTAKLRQAGADVDESGTDVVVRAPKRRNAVNVETAVYPGFPTDLQAQWMTLMTLADGVTQVSENVFENRFMHVAELQRMGADIQIKGNTATIRGVETLSGADVMVSDLRAGAALVLGALAASGKSVIHRVYHLDRGYEHLEKKLNAVGARISRGQE
ncbi:MAG TPA: UDP-N-acetylglucosamine 1-carboxyvinyltransferase [Elusimicrobiota bacterium]|nr:UDP-N-acetylglucosamine 1-carboxyvinyltransferase [Elusimicrobiota bacterium]